MAKLAATAFSVFVLPVFLLLPLLLAHLGSDSVGKTKALYTLTIHSLVGLWVAGGLMVYGISLVAWMLFIGVRRIWTKG